MCIIIFGEGPAVHFNCLVVKFSKKLNYFSLKNIVQYDLLDLDVSSQLVPDGTVGYVNFSDILVRPSKPLFSVFFCLGIFGFWWLVIVSPSSSQFFFLDFDPTIFTDSRHF